jgi:hypothetical protein
MNQAALCYQPHLSPQRRPALSRSLPHPAAATGPLHHRAPLVSRCPASSHPTCQPRPRVIAPQLSADAPHHTCLQPPLLTRVRRARATWAARPCPSGPEAPRPCHADSRGATPRPLPLRSSPAPMWHQAGPPALFLPTAPLNRHKKASPDDVPRFTVFLSQAPVHRTSSPTSFPSMPHPPTATESCRTVPVSAQTASPPAFIGERRPELRSVTTNRPPTHSLLLQAAGAHPDRR